MPSLGADMDAGTLVEWLVTPGAAVKRGDTIALVETQKGAIEIEVFEDGIFEKPLVEIGAKVPVGTALAMIGHPGEGAKVSAVGEIAETAKVKVQAPLSTSPAVTETSKPVPSAPSEQAAPVLQPIISTPEVAAGIDADAGIGDVVRAGTQAARLKITPAARRLAEKSGTEISGLTGTGPDGAIVLADIPVAAASADQAAKPVMQPDAGSGVLSGMRAAIAAAMTRSNQTIPHYYLAHHIDLSAAEDFVTQYNAGRDASARILLGALFVKAVARAAKKHPEFNGFFSENTYQPSPEVHVGVAINIRGTGLVAPAIHNTDQLELDGLMGAMRDLVSRVRAGRFRSSELSDPTITISSLGDRGVEALYGIIYPPQVALIGFGMPVMRPWVVDGMVGPRRIVEVTLAGDHRVSDGHRGALFLNAIEGFLLKPETL